MNEINPNETAPRRSERTRKNTKYNEAITKLLPKKRVEIPKKIAKKEKSHSTKHN